MAELKLSVDIKSLDWVQALIANATDLAKALEAICDEAPNSVEYSDWPELQKAVSDGREALSNFHELTSSAKDLKTPETPVLN